MEENFDFDAFAAEFATEDAADLENAFKAAEAAAACKTKDRVAYVATVDGVAHFDVWAAGRIVLRALVNEDAEVAMPEGMPVHEGVKCHAIMISTPDGKTVIPTNGRTFTMPGRSHSEGSVVTKYVRSRITRFLVQAYGIGL